LVLICVVSFSHVAHDATLWEPVIASVVDAKIRFALHPECVSVAERTPCIDREFASPKSLEMSERERGRQEPHDVPLALPPNGRPGKHGFYYRIDGKGYFGRKFIECISIPSPNIISRGLAAIFENNVYLGSQSIAEIPYFGFGDGNVGSELPNLRFAMDMLFTKEFLNLKSQGDNKANPSRNANQPNNNVFVYFSEAPNTSSGADKHTPNGNKPTHETHFDASDVVLIMISGLGALFGLTARMRATFDARGGR
jgi:hypothetical protein